MRSARGRRCALGALAAALGLGPLALGAGAGGPPAEPIDYRIDPPAEIGAFIPDPPPLSDGVAQAIGSQIDGDQLLDTFAVGLPDADGDGIPDIPQGEPGDLDLPPGTRAIEINELTGDVTLGPNTVTADAAVTVRGGGDSFLQGQCGGTAVSYSSSGEVLDAAVGVGGTDRGMLMDVFGSGEGSRAFTAGNPFEVRADGQVLYFGFLPYGGGDGARNHLWEITTAGISLDSGGDDNPDGNNANAGIVDLGENIPAAARFTGTFPIQGWLFSPNGRFCVAEGWVQFTGPFPLFTTPGAVAALFALGGIAGLLFNARPAITFRV